MKSFKKIYILSSDFLNKLDLWKINIDFYIYILDTII